MSTTPETAAPKEVLQNCAEIRFVYVIHGPKQFLGDDPLFQILADTDLILFEEVGGTPESRKDLEAEVNLILQNPGLLDREETIRRNQLLTNYQESYRFESQVVAHLAGSGKIIRYVDIDNESDAYALDQKTDNYRGQIEKLLLLGDLPKAIEIYHQLMDVLIQSYRLREETVSSQIPTLINETPCSHPKVVSVIQGLTHLETANIFSSDHPGATISIHQIVPFTPCSTRVLQKLRQGETVSETDHQRAFLADYLLIFAVAPEMDADTPIDEKALADLYRLVDKLSPDQVNAALSRFELHFKQKAKHFKHFAFGQAVNSLLADLKRWTGN